MDAATLKYNETTNMIMTALESFLNFCDLIDDKEDEDELGFGIATEAETTPDNKEGNQPKEASKEKGEPKENTSKKEEPVGDKTAQKKKGGILKAIKGVFEAFLDWIRSKFAKKIEGSEDGEGSTSSSSSSTIPNKAEIEIPNVPEIKEAISIQKCTSLIEKWNQALRASDANKRVELLNEISKECSDLSAKCREAKQKYAEEKKALKEKYGIIKYYFSLGTVVSASRKAIKLAEQGDDVVNEAAYAWKAINNLIIEKINSAQIIGDDITRSMAKMRDDVKSLDDDMTGNSKALQRLNKKLDKTNAKTEKRAKKEAEKALARANKGNGEAKTSTEPEPEPA